MAISGRLPSRSDSMQAPVPRRSASRSRAASGCPPRAASSPAPPGRTAQAGRSTRRPRRTSAATRHSWPQKPRLRKKRIGSIGAGERSSQATKAPRSSSPAAIEAITVVLVQPSACARTIPSTSLRAPHSRGQRRGRRACRSARGSRAVAPGRLGRAPAPRARSARRSTARRSPPRPRRPLPARAPPQAPTPLTDPERETAPLCRERVVQERQRERGSRSRPRALDRAGGDQRLGRRRERAAAADAIVKIPNPAAKTCRRPSRSPSAAPVSRKTATIGCRR